MIHLTFGNRLDAISWSRMLAELAPQVVRHRTGAQPFGDAIYIDLSQVGFADFVALGHLLVFSRAAVDAGAEITIRLPERAHLPGEDAQRPDDATRRLMRQNSRLYLEHAGFIGAAGELVSFDERIRTSDRPAADVIDPGAPQEASKLPHRRRQIMAYRWIPSTYGRSLTASPSGTAFLEVALRDLGLPAEDAAALAKGVLAELIENSAEHSGATQILIGAAVVQPENYRTRTDHFDPTLDSYVRWAADTGSSMVRLVVADAGRGIVDALAATKTAGSDNPSDAQASRLNDRQDTIIYALNRWSTSSGSPAGLDRGARGLWKVESIVRSYQGSLLISTGGELAGMVFNDQYPQGRVIARTAAWPAPGTFIECDILSRPNELLSASSEEVATPWRLQPDPRPILRCVTATLRMGQGFDADDLERIENTLSALPTAAGGMVIAVDVPDGGDAIDDREIRDSVRQVLAVASAAANPATVTLAFPSINRRLLRLAVEDLNSEQHAGASGSSDMKNPILVLAPENRHYWAGGTPEIRTILRALSRHTEPLRLHEISPFATAEASIRQIRDQTALLRRRGNTLTLKLRPRDAVAALVRYLNEEIRRSIDDPASPGVYHGKFLTPNLRITSRWCDVGELLAGLRLQGLAGFGLAARYEEQVGRIGRDEPPPVILRVGGPPHGLMTALAKSLIGSDAYYDSLDDMRLERPGRVVDEHRRVLVVTDLVSTQRTLAEALAQVMDRGMEPIAVAAVVDSRVDLAVDELHEITFEGERVPLVALATANIEPKPDDRLAAIPIDPVLRRPGLNQPKQLHQLFTQSAYVEALGRNDAIRLGHIERPAGRHYSAYVDPTKLLRDARWRHQVMSRLINRIRTVHGEFFDGDRSAGLCVLYPQRTADDLPDVAQALHDSLADAGFVMAGILAVPRATFNAKWHLPAHLPMPPGTRHAVLLDSAAASGDTINQLIRLAADQGVETVTAILLLNGLDEREAANLLQTATVHRSLPPGIGQTDGVPLRLFFVARTAMSARDRRDCGVCAMAQRYRSPQLLEPLPKKLAGHRDWLLSNLMPRSKMSAFHEQATDLLGAHVSQADCLAYLEWRFELREAALDTVRRQEVVKKITAAADSPTQRDGLLRLLVAEPHWLRSAPLWFPDCRAQVAGLATGVLLGDGALAIDPMLRVQTIILLALAAPNDFARNVLAILKANRHHESVVMQLLLETLRLLSGSNGPVPQTRDDVMQLLVQKLIILENNLRDPLDDAEELADVVDIATVRYLLSHGRRALLPFPSDPQGAWAALRRHWRSIEDHHYQNAIWRVLVSVDLLGHGGRPPDLESIREDWAFCSDFLLRDVLPHLHFLGDYFRGAIPTEMMDHDDVAHWEKVLSGDGPQDLDDITLRLDALLDRLRAEDRPHMFPLDGLDADLDWWNRFLLSVSDPSVLLVRTLRSCPADVVATLKGVFPPDTIWSFTSTGQMPDKMWVFCPSSLLKDFFTHVVINATQTHRSGDEQPKFEVTLSAGSADPVIVTVWNTASEPSDAGGGNGLRATEAALSEFGAVLHRPAPVAPWTFGISVTLQPWRMAI